jgi:ribosomal protein S18 acetylase RimI-like enzyme
MIIGLLSADQLEDAVELWIQTGLTRPWNDPLDDLRRALATPSSTVLGGIADGKLVATAMVGHDGHRGWVYYLAVRPDMQRNGHGRAIMNACESWLTDREVPKLNVMVRFDNAAAVGFYEAMGYRADEVSVLSRRLHES